MSDPLLGEAGNANPEPAALGGTGGDEFTNLDGPAGSVAKAPRRRRRGSRGGRSRHGAAVLVASSADDDDEVEDAAELSRPAAPAAAALPVAALPVEGEPPAVVAVAKPKIGDTRPGSPPAPKRRVRKETGTGPAKVLAKDAAADGYDDSDDASGVGAARRPRRRKPVAGEPGPGTGSAVEAERAVGADLAAPAARTRPSPRARAGAAAVAVAASDRPAAPRRAGGDRADRADRAGTDKASLARNRPLGRYLMAVHVGPTATQIAVLEGRTLIEHYVSRPADDATQIDGNIYLGRVQNVLPGMEAAFVDIGTPKNAVLYRGDLHYDADEVEPPTSDDGKPTRGRLGGAARDARIEQLLRTGQSIICQVTKNPIGTKGARLTQEVSLPGRFVVLIPDSDTYGISKRLGDDERRRLRKILDDIRPAGHGLIVRTAAEGASAEELGRDVGRLLRQWESVQQIAKTSRAPQLLYREPDLAVRVIREEFNRDYRGVVIDDQRLYDQVKEYVTSITPELADRVELVDPNDEALPLFERFRVHEQVHKALDRKVWLPSGGSIIIERTEALTVIDVNTGKNVGTSNLEETVFRNNLEAAEEIARQLRLRDIGGIIVIDFIDMEIMANRAEVIRTFREALARDKTRSQVFDISELGLVEMTRKRISEGLVESYSETCPTCGGRGIIFDESLL
jgi:ribonuclease E